MVPSARREVRTPIRYKNDVGGGRLATLKKMEGSAVFASLWAAGGMGNVGNLFAWASQLSLKTGGCSKGVVKQLHALGSEFEKLRGRNAKGGNDGIVCTYVLILLFIKPVGKLRNKKIDILRPEQELWYPRGIATRNSTIVLRPKKM